MTVTRWNPFAELEQILDRYNRDARLPSSAGEGKEVISKADWAPVVDISESKNQFTIKAELPGIKKEDIKLSVHEGVLAISGERRSETTEEDEKHHRIERFYGSFSRSFTLPENVDEENIDAEYQDGILTVRLAKVEKSKPKAIDINIK